MTSQFGKRKLAESGTKSSKAKKTVPHTKNLLDDGSEFGNCLVKTGADLRKDLFGVLLDKDPTSFRQHLSKCLKLHLDYPTIIDEAVQSLSKHIEDVATLKLFLAPVLQKHGEETTTFGLIGPNDSFVKVLLNVEELQQKLMNLLLDKIVALSTDEKNDDEQLCRSIVKQFCWLDVIASPENLTDKIFETIMSCPGEVQQEVIVSLPEIVVDAQHSRVAASLENLTSSQPHLLLSIVYALDNLNIPDDCLRDVRASVTEALTSTDLEQLPVVLKFLFQHVTVDDAAAVVQKIRRNVKLTGDMSTRPASTPMRKAARKKESSKGAFSLVVGALKSIRFHKPVSCAWLKAIEDAKEAEQIQTVDVFVFLILHSCEEHRKMVEGILRKKIMSEVVTTDNIAEAFSVRSEVMEDFFKPVMQLAENFLRSTYQVVIRFACNLYKISFSQLSSYCQQEIVAKLVSYIGSGCSSDIDVVLDILVDLVQSNLNKMMPFVSFINGLFDYLDNLDLMQVKKLYHVLSRLAVSSHHNSSVQDGLHIIITKQLSSHDSRFQQIGVVGGLIMVTNLSLSNAMDHDVSYCISQSRSMRPSGDEIQPIKDMLEMIQSNVWKSPQTLGLFYEELALLFRKNSLNKVIEKWTTEKIENDFQLDFVADVNAATTTNEGSRQHGELVWTVQYRLDPLEAGDDSVALNVLPLINQEPLGVPAIGKGDRLPSVWCLSSSFRLLHTCQSSTNDNKMDDIEALLGCGIKLPKNFPDSSGQLVAKGEKEKTIHLHCAFILINWFRELLNAFADQNDEEMRTKVIKRLQSVILLQSLIEKMLMELPDYMPPCNLDSTHNDQPCTSLVVLPKKPKTVKIPKVTKKQNLEKKGTGRKRKRDGLDGKFAEKENVNNITFGDILPNATPAPNSSKLNKSSMKINQSVLSTYFRELDLSVFEILKYTKLSNPKLSDSSPELAGIKLTLDPSNLVFLLEDLFKKVDHSLSKSSEKRKTFLKVRSVRGISFRNLGLFSPQEIAGKVCHLFPHLCRHLESLSVYFQLNSEVGDDNYDESCSDLEENRLMSVCVSLFIQVFASFFLWSDLGSSSNKALLQSALSHISARLSSSTTLELPEMFQHSYNYVEKFGGSLQEIPSAVHLVKLLSSLSILSPCQDLKSKTGQVALSFLKKKWKEETKQADFNISVAVLLDLCFTHTDDVQSLIELLFSSAVSEFLQSEDSSDTFPTMNKDTLPVFYRTLLHHLHEYSRTITPGNVHTSIDENTEKLLVWSASVKVFGALINLIKTFDSRANLMSALKYGRKFLECFMRQGMPTLDLLLTSRRDDIQALFKSLQLSTRFLHHLCSHSKIKKDVTLINQVPQLKCTLEGFIQRVKDMLNKNKCVAAFWLGNLKNRDIKGGEMLSQATVCSSESEKEDDDNNQEEAEVGAAAADDDEDEDCLLEGVSDDADDVSSKMSKEKRGGYYSSDELIDYEDL